MPSPFPGMNPYLEQDRVWHDFHQRFIPQAAQMLGPVLAPKYIVRIESHMYVRELPATARRYLGRSGVAVSRTSVPEVAGGGTLMAAPARVQIPAVDIEKQSYLEIRDRDNWRLVTVVELLSPSNKYAGSDREQYLGKRSELLNSPVHFVEIDLLRGGPRMPLDDLPACDYYVMVSRVQDRPDAGLWPIRLRDRLPLVPVPLQLPDGDAQLDLQAVLHHVYDAAQYAIYLYLDEPQPKLSSEDKAWAQALVPEKTSTQ